MVNMAQNFMLSRTFHIRSGWNPVRDLLAWNLLGYGKRTPTQPTLWDGGQCPPYVWYLLRRRENTR